MSDRSSREFADRFFKRQRREILDRIHARQRQRRDRWSAAGLAAAAIVAAALVFLVVARGPAAGAAAEPAMDWIAETAPADDALAIFASWELTGDEEPPITALPELGEALSTEEPLSWFDPYAPSLLPATDELS